MRTLKIFAVLEKAELESLRAAACGSGLDGAAVEAFSSELEALQFIYIKGRPDLFVLDLDLEGATGIETVRAMRRHADLASLPILLLSGRDFDEKAVGAGGTCLISKPATPDGLRGALARCLSCLHEKGRLVQVRAGASLEAQNQAGPDARKALRRPFETPCVMNLAGKRVRGVLKDISLTGARVSLSDPAPLRSMVTLLLGVPGTVPLKVVQFKARLVRQSADDCGLAFCEMDSDTRSFVLSYTRKRA